MPFIYFILIVFLFFNVHWFDDLILPSNTNFRWDFFFVSSLGWIVISCALIEIGTNVRIFFSLARTSYCLTNLSWQINWHRVYFCVHLMRFIIFCLTRLMAIANSCCFSMANLNFARSAPILLHFFSALSLYLLERKTWNCIRANYFYALRIGVYARCNTMQSNV